MDASRKAGRAAMLVLAAAGALAGCPPRSPQLPPPDVTVLDADAGSAEEGSPAVPDAGIGGVDAVPPEEAEAAWHEPSAEREPATEAARKIVETLESIESGLTATRYQHRTVVRERSGVYYWDCAGMVAWVLERAAPKARAALSEGRPPAREFYDRIAESPTDEPHRGWLRLASPEDVAPGDLFAWRKPDFWPDRPNTGHVGFIVGTPQPHPEFESVWVVRVADATEYRHEADSRRSGGEGGFGTGTMAFWFDDSGTPTAYGWYGASQPPDTFVPTLIAFGRVSR